MKNNENMYVLAIILFVISAVVALLLSFTNSITAEKIEANTIKEQTEARIAVMPDASAFTNLNIAEEDVVKEVYEAKKADKTIGYCVGVAPVGFGGEINMMVGIDNNQKVTGIKIVSLSETPGLGSKAQEDTFKNQFSGKSSNKAIKVIKSGSPKDDEIVAISGATITSTAVTNGVNAAIDAIKNLK